MNLLMLALMVVPAVDGGAGLDAGDNTLGEIRRLSGPLKASVTSPWVKAWVHAAKGLKPAAPRTYYCGDHCELTPFDGGTRRDVNDELYYARVADPLGYVRPFEVLAGHGVSIGKGTRFADLGYGSIGHLMMLEKLGAEVTGIEVNPLLPLMYANAQGARLHILHGYFPQDAQLVKKLGSGFDVFMSKNTLKRGYVHPDPQTKAKAQLEFGMSDVETLKVIYGLLKPGGVFFIYNFSPPAAHAGHPFIPWSDGRSAFTREAYETAGFEVVAYDVDDSNAGRVSARLMEWNKSDTSGAASIEDTVNALYTLARRPKRVATQ